MTQSPHVVVVVPASDVAASEFRAILSALPEAWGVLLVANGLPAEFVYAFAGCPAWRPRIAAFERALGKAEAVRRGLGLLATEATVRVVAQVDGHLKQPVSALRDLVAVVERKKADLVVADRYALQDLSDQTHRRALVHAVRAIITGLTGLILSDTASGMRAYSAEVAQRFATDLRAFGYGLEFEQLLLAAAWGARVSEVGVPSRRQADATNAEKHEDGFAALCLRARDVGATPEQQELLCSYLVALKERRDFVLDFPGSIHKVLMAYVGDTEEEEDAYSAVFLDEVAGHRCMAAPHAGDLRRLDGGQDGSRLDGEEQPV